LKAGDDVAYRAKCCSLPETDPERIGHSRPELSRKGKCARGKYRKIVSISVRECPSGKDALNSVHWGVLGRLRIGDKGCRRVGGIARIGTLLVVGETR